MPVLGIDIKARVAAFQDSLDKVGKQGERVAKQMDSAFGGLKATLATFGVGLSVGGLAAFVKSGIDAADNLNKLAQKVGVSVESLSAFQYAAKLADVSSEQLSTGLAKLARTASDAQGGSKEAGEAFAALGVNVTNAQGGLRGTEELLLDVAERFAKIEDGAGKTAIAMRIFGRSGAELIPFLNAGRGGIEALRKEAERLGIIISSETARSAEQFNDSMTRLGQSANTVKIALTANLLQPLERIAQRMADAAREGDGFLGKLSEISRGLQQSIVLPTFGGNAEEQIKNLDLEIEKHRKRFSGIFTPGPALRLLTDARESNLLGLRDAAQEELRRRQEADARAGDQPALPRPQARALASSTRPAASAREQDSEFQKLMRQLDALAQKSRELSTFEETYQRLQEERYAKLTPIERERALARAAEVDAMKETVRVQAENLAAVEAGALRQAQLSQAQTDRLRELRERFIELADPAAKYREQLEQIQELWRRGLLDPGQVSAANAALYEQLAALDKTGQQIRESNNLWQEYGFTATSAFEDAVVGGKKLSEVLRGLAQDVARIAFRETVSKPIGEQLGKLLSGDLFSGRGGAVDSVLAAGTLLELPFLAGGGNVAAGKPVVVGERGPELFVPIQPGRIIPNGAVGGGTVNLTINFSANTPSAVREAVYSMAPKLTEMSVAAVNEARLRGVRV